MPILKVIYTYSLKNFYIVRKNDIRFSILFTIFSPVWDEAQHWHDKESWADLTDFGQVLYQQDLEEE